MFALDVWWLYAARMYDNTDGAVDLLFWTRR